jgi:cytochrome b
MAQHIEDKNNVLGPFAILIHLGLLAFGITAWLTGFLADDYKRMAHPGFSVHSWLGLGLAAFAGLRLLTGIIGPRSVQFLRWMPFTPMRIKLVLEDIAGLLKFRMPDRATHQGLSGLVQTFGLLVFFFMAATGAYLYFFLEPGQKAHGFIHDAKELHEIGVPLVPAFLSLHAGAVIMHALRGNHIWRKIFFISDTIGKRQSRPDALPERS